MIQIAHQIAEHAKYPPRVRPNCDMYVVDIYSPKTHGYIIGSEHTTPQDAETALRAFQVEYEAKQASLKALAK